MHEFDLLKHVFAANRQLPVTVTIPPGDDMGAVQLPSASSPDDALQVLLTVDQLADTIHFDLASMPLEKIGRKAVTRNLSDVAAMACRPIAAVAAACLPKTMPSTHVHQLFDAMRQTAAHYDCPLIGGDVSIWDSKLILTITILAQPWNSQVPPILRSGAKPGDLIYVSGRLGASFASGHHLDFTPRIALARQLAENPDLRPTSMIDLSDGLGRDLAHICEMSAVSAIIDAHRLPLRSPSALHWQQALSDGEDYELCFTLSPQHASSLPSELDSISLTHIGHILPASPQTPPVQIRLPDGNLLPAHQLGWEHHTQPR